MWDEWMTKSETEQVSHRWKNWDTVRIRSYTSLREHVLTTSPTRPNVPQKKKPEQHECI